VPYGTWSLVAIEAGLDGCTGLALAAPGTDIESMRFYVCTPELELPFAVGDAIAIELPPDAVEGLAIRAVEIDTGTPLVPVRELVVSRGTTPARVADLDSTFVAKFDCPLTVDACGTVAQAGVLVLGGPGWPTAEIGAGETVVLEHVNGAVVHMALAHGQDRSVVADACALGPASLGLDVEIAATHVGAAQ
jgi:hypothetical protein